MHEFISVLEDFIIEMSLWMGHLKGDYYAWVFNCSITIRELRRTRKVKWCKKVTKVVVKIGVLSGVEPELLQTAFDTFKEQTVCNDAQFIINVQQIEILCNQCNTNSTLQKMSLFAQNVKVLI